MNSMPQMVRLPAPSEVVANEFGQELHAAKKDVSDPEACFNFLYDLYPARWREVMSNFDGAVYAAGQMRVAEQVERIG